MTGSSLPGERPRRARHPIFARAYARLGQSMERAGAAEHRHALLSEISGRVIDLGAGTGASFPHYPHTVTSVVAVEPERHLREIAQRVAGRAATPVEVVDAIAEDLPLPDASFDAAVTFLVLCSVTDQRRSLEELHRVLKPGGELRFFEHVRAVSPGLRRVQRLVDATVWPRINGGCHTARDTLAAMERVGFELVSSYEARFPPTRLTLPSTLHVGGIARRT